LLRAKEEINHSYFAAFLVKKLTEHLYMKYMKTLLEREGIKNTHKVRGNLEGVSAIFPRLDDDAINLQKGPLKDLIQNLR